MSAKETITKELFASLVLNLLSGRGENNWTINHADFALRCETGGEPKVLNLSRLYQDYLNLDSPENFQSLTKHIDLLLNSRPVQAGDPELLSCLLPFLQSYASHQQTNETCRKQPDSTHAHELIFFPYADVLGIGLVFDKGETMQHARYLDLEKLGIEAEEAIDIAVQNLKRLSVGPFRTVQPGFYTSPWKDYYDGARLMLTELFADLQVEGEKVALSPTPDSLFVTGSQDQLGLELMTVLGQSLMHNPRSVSAIPLVLRDGVWQPFILHADDPAFHTINSYRMNILSHLYQVQDAILSEAAKESGSFVSPFVIDTDQTREFLFSKTSVIEDCTSIIPEADVIEFFRRGEAGKKECLARAPFETVSSVLNQTMIKDPTFRPGRWHLSVFPSESELNLIGIMPPLQSPLQSTPLTELEELARLFSMPLPEGTRIDSQLTHENNEFMVHFAVSCTPVELSEFYMNYLPIGCYISLMTEQGDFLVAEVIGANCTREVLFGPSKKRGETFLRWCKRTNYDTPSIVNALSKQSDELRSMEQIFGLSIINDGVPDGELKLTDKNASQNFTSAFSHDVVAAFFRCQMSHLKPFYLPVEDGSPHLITDLTSGMSVTIKSTPSPEGTLFNLSRTFGGSTK